MYVAAARDPQMNMRAEMGADFRADLRTETVMPAAETIIEKISAIDARFPSQEELAAAMRADETAEKKNANPTFAFAIPATVQIAPPETASPSSAPARTPPARPKLASIALYNPKAADDAKPSHAPVRLASLTPPDELNLKSQDDTHGPRTAIYDITAQALYMPDGETLEVHSGLGSFMDNPSHVHLKMRGATPPNSYRLTMREKKFHGVEAVRMNPENEDAMMGRAGILVHPYMLGPSGQSNGCLSVKDYAKFLSAFKRGEVDRIVVVSKLDNPPAYARAKSRNPWTAWLQKSWLQKIF